MTTRTSVEAVTGGPLVIETARAGERVFSTAGYSHIALSLTCLELDSGLLVVDLEHQVRSRIRGQFDRWQPGPPVWKPATAPASLTEGQTIAAVINRHPAVIGVSPALRVSWNVGEGSRARFALTLFGIDG